MTEKKNEWIELDPQNVNTLPPPFEPLEVEAQKGVLFSKCPRYVLCTGIRTGVKTLELRFAYNHVITVNFLAVKRWRFQGKGAKR